MRQVDPTDIDALLPQTQCTRCGYAGCLPYAQALAAGSAQINQCPPGGAALIGKLAALLECEPLALDPHYGVEGAPRLAWIDPEQCIGCARCLPPCPVDAILGAQRQMHSVITSWCTGCELCLSVCPVDCIHMVPWPQATTAPTAPQNRDRYRAHLARRARTMQQREDELRQLKQQAAADERAT
ncbi:MAG TPA: RnfABCDGE type electron transport complex subunit B [Steroidobacteraceae bacterium]|nr:RnfABCDGE type electron transport complex subunit B [Steroidobacteraceae bacterium]